MRLRLLSLAFALSAFAIMFGLNRVARIAINYNIGLWLLLKRLFYLAVLRFE